jgi:hypothetical protein
MFAVRVHAVRSKLMMFLAPFLGRWTYTRQLEQVCVMFTWKALVAPTSQRPIYRRLLLVRWTIDGVVIEGLASVQITGGHKYLPPRLDVNAPDLYIPFMAVCTYCLLASISKTLDGRFTPDTMYATVSHLDPSLRRLQDVCPWPSSDT